MEDSLKECLDEFFQNRVAKILREIEHDEEIKKLEASIMMMQKELIENSDEKISTLFIEYEDAVNHQYGIITEKLYRAAFKDALQIKSKINNSEP